MAPKTLDQEIAALSYPPPWIRRTGSQSLWSRAVADLRAAPGSDPAVLEPGLGRTRGQQPVDHASP